ncbi:MAG: dienelactone hydrolase family protein [Ignavibacteriales bacterium]|nr:MAG: dienelactone hydrolase family protein [Ignavibacteriaceae bacterium]MBW7873356.1 dienelactone hydrolase family protein [Ignavibacteria bacterium]MCZ2142046.1 dienelactone hydrolase family protein [Ignavibacteriales bacterium]OQY79271.1 MAG: hypothetical protein B6D45_01115 [Ignavibacteriales bacterium UTCHB3]MBV6444783.1 hypothetical protein [Ignavibacteriaceae bacterium]
MKKIAFSLFIMLFAAGAYAQGDARLDGRGGMIPLTLSDRTKSDAYFVRAEKQSNKWLFLFHEWWGLNDYIKNEAEKYAAAFPDLNVLALDLYDGKVVFADNDSANALKNGIKADRAFKIIDAASKHAGAKAQIGTLGWCMGGYWSMQASIRLGAKSKACVLYYGMPEMDKKKLKTLTAPVLGIFGNQDLSITPEVVASFIKVYRPFKRKYEIKKYDATHAFANPSAPGYNATYAKEAEEQAMQFIGKYLMGRK